MKKRIALLVILALVLTAIFSACNSVTATKIIPRWNDGESYEYTVSLGDFAASGNNYFNSYDMGERGIYYKDFVVRAGETFNSLDEVRPLRVYGTYTLTIKQQDEYDVVTTKQSLLVSYTAQNGKIQLVENDLVELNAELKKLVVNQDADSVTLKSESETMVKFVHNEKQTPVESYTKMNGFYIGKTNQEASAYEISTVYNYEEKRPVAETTLSVNGGGKQTISETLKGQSAGSFIDSNQLFMYARSIDKSSTSFQDNPNVYVYNPFDQSMQVASFAFTREVNAMLNDSTHENFLTKLPTIGVLIDGMPFLLQENAPNFKEKFPDLFDEVGNGPDSVYFGGFTYAKHTPVRFRVGFLSYELSSYPDELYNTLCKTVATPEKAQ